MANSTEMTWQQWEKTVQAVTERYLTWRKRRKIARREKQKKKNPIVDWLDAIGSAVVIVLLINQYLLQAYQIPSPSMVPSLLVGDRIFVNKLVYGPELIPGMLKVPGFRAPSRADVIIFESPEYISSGPLKDILQRVIYMVTLSIVDIDRDEYGQPKHHFLIKRAIGMRGDRIRMRDGNVEIRTPGEADWKTEAQLKADLGFTYPNTRTLDREEYPFFRSAGEGFALELANLSSTDGQKKAIARYFVMNRDSSGSLSLEAFKLSDEIAIELWKNRTRWALEPYSTAYRETWRMLEEGQRIPDDRLFPMGDNRDNSRDARYFGAVRLAKVLGKGLLRYWPLTRFGAVR
jgi:signal peptidase I